MFDAWICETRDSEYMVYGMSSFFTTMEHGDLFLAAYDVPALGSVNFYPDYLKDAWEIVVRSKKPAKTEPHSSFRQHEKKKDYVVKPIDLHFL